LREADVSYTIFDETEPNPRVSTVEKGADLFNRVGAHLIIARTLTWERPTQIS
jgi:alcohol dehydrogenase class IV